MSRFKKSEYITEKRSRPVDKLETFKRCQGDMGMCKQKKNLVPCEKCLKPYCAEHAKDHPKYCLGVQQ